MKYKAIALIVIMFVTSQVYALTTIKNKITLYVGDANFVISTTVDSDPNFKIHNKYDGSDDVLIWGIADLHIIAVEEIRVSGANDFSNYLTIGTPGGVPTMSSTSGIVNITGAMRAGGLAGTSVSAEGVERLDGTLTLDGGRGVVIISENPSSSIDILPERGNFGLLRISGDATKGVELTSTSGQINFTTDVRMEDDLIGLDTAFDIFWKTSGGTVTTKIEQLGSDLLTIDPDVDGGAGTVNFANADLVTTANVECDELIAETDNQHRIVLDPGANAMEFHPGDETNDNRIRFFSADTTDIYPQITPIGDAKGQLGIAALRWKDLFLSNSANIGDTVITDGVITDATGLLLTAEITLSDGKSLNLQEAITFTGATTENLIEIPDALVVALDIKEAGNSYLTFVTSNGGEKITLGKKLEAGAVEIEGSAFDIDGGDVSAITVSGGLTWSAAQDLNNQNLTNVDIDSGTIDAVTIGQASVATIATIDNITIDAATILSDSGAISFGDENLTTTGTIDTGIATVDGLVMGDGEFINIVDDTAEFKFGNAAAGGTSLDFIGNSANVSLFNFASSAYANELILALTSGASAFSTPNILNFTSSASASASSVSFSSTLGSILINAPTAGKEIKMTSTVNVDGDLVFNGDGDGVAFGECHQTDNATFAVTMTTANTYVEVNAATTNINATELNLVTFPDDHYLLVEVKGKYFVTYHFLAEIDSVAGGTQHVESAFMVNGTQVANKAIGHNEYSATNRQRTYQGMNFLDLAANDQVSLGIVNTTTSGKILTIDHLNITVTLVGGT